MELKNKIIAFILSVFAIGGSVFGADVVGKASIDDNLKLKVEKERILGSELNGDTIKYSYISDTEEPKRDNGKLKEDISKRTKSAITYENGTKDIYMNDSFIEYENKWRAVDYATTTKKDFEKQTISLLDRMFSGVSATDYITGAGDGRIRNEGAVWATIHDATTGDNAYPTETVGFASTGKNVANFQINRQFFPVDTSAIDDGATISSSSLYFYIEGSENSDNDGDDFLTVVQTDQPNATTLTTADYNNCGATADPTEGNDSGNRIDMTGLGVSYYGIKLNATGIGWISKTGTTLLGLREGHDVLDNVYAGANSTYNYAQISNSETAGTGQDPFLRVEITVPVVASNPEPLMFGVID